MAATFSVKILRVATGGPYVYSVIKNGIGLTAADTQANANAAIDAAKTDIANNLAGETIQSISLNVATS